eukprot:1376474-Prorocentrum_lima.AAC.1
MDWPGLGSSCDRVGETLWGPFIFAGGIRVHNVFGRHHGAAHSIYFSLSLTGVRLEAPSEEA